MDGHGHDANLFRGTGKVFCDDVLRVPAEPDLDRHRDPRRFHDRGHDLLSEDDIPQERRTRAGPKDLRHRAAHVDVDKIHFADGNDLGGLGHGLGRGTEDLEDHGPFCGVGVEHAEGALVLPHQGLDAQHLRVDEAGAHLLADHAEGEIGDPGHRRQDQRVLTKDFSDVHGGIIRDFGHRANRKARSCRALRS